MHRFQHPPQAPPIITSGLTLCQPDFFLRGAGGNAPHAPLRCTFCATSVPLGGLSDGTENFKQPCGVAAYMYLSTYIYIEIYII